MAVTLTAPGVYLRGSELAPAPVGSAITGFVGVPERGPINVPQPLRGWRDYVDTFGGFVSYGYLAESVFGFFRNGGEKCWAVRAADTSRLSAPSSSTAGCLTQLHLSSSRVDLDDVNAVATLRVDAIDPGEWGNRLVTRVSTSQLPLLRVATLTSPTTSATTEIFADSVVDLLPGMSIRIAAPDGVTSVADYTVRPLTSALSISLGRIRLTTPVGRVYPTGSVVYAAGFRLDAEFRGRRETFDPVSLREDHPRYVVRVVNAPASMTDYGERRLRGYSSLIAVTHLRTSAGVSRFRPTDTAGDVALGGGSTAYTQATAAFRNAAGNVIVRLKAEDPKGIDGNGLIVTAVPFEAKLALPVPHGTPPVRDTVVLDNVAGFSTSDVVRIGLPATPGAETATPSQVLPADMLLRFPGNLLNPHAVGASVSVADRFNLEVRRPGDREPRESVRNIAGGGTARPIVAVLQNESRMLCADAPPAAFTTPIVPPATTASVTLAGGADPSVMDARYYTGYESDGSYFAPADAQGRLVGLSALERVEEISLVSVPDLVRLPATAIVGAQTSVLRHCARLGDRFALLDAPDPVSMPTEDWSAALGTPALRTYGAAYHPWIRGVFAEEKRLAPPSGLVAGIIARTDATRGVNIAPANANAVGGFALEPSVDRERHGQLNPHGVNCFVKLDDGQLRLMGGRTLSAERETRFVNVRRTILSVKKVLSQRMLWAVFEPISDALFARLEATLITALQALLAAGATASQRAADAFYVKCDRTNNPPELQATGTVLAEIGIALLAPAEFIVLTVRRTPDAVQVVEEDV